MSLYTAVSIYGLLLLASTTPSKGLVLILSSWPPTFASVPFDVDYLTTRYKCTNITVTTTFFLFFSSPYSSSFTLYLSHFFFFSKPMYRILGCYCFKKSCVFLDLLHLFSFSGYKQWPVSLFYRLSLILCSFLFAVVFSIVGCRVNVWSSAECLSLYIP